MLDLYLNLNLNLDLDLGTVIHNRSSIKQIIIARGDMLGDVILTTGIIQPLKKAFPEARITFLVKKDFIEIFDRHPDVDDCIEDPMPYTFSIWAWSHWKQFFSLLRTVKSMDCELFIGAWYRPRYAWLSVLAGIPYRVGHGFYWVCRRLYNYLSDFDSADFTYHHFEWVYALVRAIGIEDDSDDGQRSLSLSMEESYLTTLKAQYNFLNSDYICLHVDAGNPRKMMMPDFYVDLVTYLLTLGKTIVLFGRDVDGSVKQKILERYPDHPQVKSIVGVLSVADLVPFISGCDLYVGTDSGPGHIAAAVGVKTIICFVNRCQNPLEWGPWRSPHRLVFSIHPCIDVCRDTLCQKTTCREVLSVPQFKSAIEEVKELESPLTEFEQRLYWLKTAVVIGVLDGQDPDYRQWCTDLIADGFRVHRFSDPSGKGKLSFSHAKSFFVRYNRTMIVFPNHSISIGVFVARKIASNYISFFPQFFSKDQFEKQFLIEKK